MMPNSEKGFTLIEVLIVIVILSILLSIFVPMVKDRISDRQNSSLTSVETIDRSGSDNPLM